MVCIYKKSCCLAWRGNQNWNQKKSSRTTGKISTCKFLLLLHCEIYFLFNQFINVDILPPPCSSPSVPPAIYWDSFCGLSKSREGIHAPLSCLLSHEIYYTGFQAEYFVLETEMKCLLCERSDKWKQKHGGKDSRSFQAGFSSVVGDKELIILYGLYESVFTGWLNLFVIVLTLTREVTYRLTIKKKT